MALAAAALVLIANGGGVAVVRSASDWPLFPSTIDRPAQTAIPAGNAPSGVAFDPVNDLLYVADFGSNNVSVINTTTNQIITQIPLTHGIQRIAVDTANGAVYVADTFSTVYEISPYTNQVVQTISLAGAGCSGGCAPSTQTFDPANGDIYVTELVSGDVSAIHGAAVVATIPVGVSPNGAAYDSANGEVYVANEGTMNLSVINGTTNRIVGQVSPVGPGPGVTYDSSNGEIFVCENGIETGFSNFVTVANGTTNQVVASIPIGSACGGAVYDPSNDYVYITDRTRPGGQDLSNVTLVDPDTNQIVLTLPVQLAPFGIAYDSANTNVYVANLESNTISILPQIYRLTVHESGLPTGTNWSATVGGTTFTSTTPTITFPETNGTFDFTIANVTNRTANPYSGTVTVAGGPRELNVTFSKGGGSGLFGLPGATGYYVLAGIGAVAAILIAVVVIRSRRSKRAASPGPPPPPPSPPTTENRPP